MRNFLLFILLLFISSNAFAQNNKGWLFGGSASADFGSFQNRLMITPYVAKRVLPKTYAGANITIAYFGTETTYYTDPNDLSTEVLIKDRIGLIGGGPFVQFVPFESKENFLKNFFLETRYEYLFGIGSYHDNSGQYEYTTGNHTAFLGLGYKQPLTDKLKLNAQISFRLNKDAYSPYKNPIIQLGFEF